MTLRFLSAITFFCGTNHAYLDLTQEIDLYSEFIDQCEEQKRANGEGDEAEEV
jgi:transcription elongation factor Elf1